MPKQHNRVIIASLARGNFYRPLKSLIDSIILLLQLQGHNYIINFFNKFCSRRLPFFVYKNISYSVAVVRNSRNFQQPKNESTFAILGDPKFIVN